MAHGGSVIRTPDRNQIRLADQTHDKNARNRHFNIHFHHHVQSECVRPGAWPVHKTNMVF